MDVSSCDGSKSSENQGLPTLKDPKGCLDITPNHQKDDDNKKIVVLHQDLKGCQDITMGDDDTKKIKILHQDPKGCQEITMDHQLDDDKKKIVVLPQDPKGCQDVTKDHQQDDDTNKIVVVHQDPKGCQDITMDHQKDDDNKKIVVLHQDPKGCQVITIGHQKDVDHKKVVVLHQEPKGCQDVTIDHQQDDDTKNMVVLHRGPNISQDHLREDGVVNETIVAQPVEHEVVPEDDDDGFRTPTSLESKIPILTTCPPAPKPKRCGIKRKAPSRRWQSTIRVWIDYPHRGSGRFWPENQETNNTSTSRRMNTN